MNYVDPDGHFQCALPGFNDEPPIPGPGPFSYHPTLVPNMAMAMGIHTGWMGLGPGYQYLPQAAAMAASVTEQTRKNVLQEVLGDKASNIAARIGEKNSDCWKYLQGVIDKLGISSLSSPQDLINHLNNATYVVMGDQNGTFTDGPARFGTNGNIWAEATTAGYLGTGSINKVTLGWKFFSSTNMNPSSVLIHEAFHLFSGTMVLGFNVTGLSDSTLFAAEGVNSAKEFNWKIDDNCK